MIDLTALEITGGTTPRLLDWGGELTPPFGGVSQRIDRLGSRHSIDVVVPPKAMEPDGRIWISRLKRAKQQGGIIAFPQPDFEAGAPGAPLVASAVAAGSVVPLKGLNPGYVVREGQWLSISHGGRWYIYSVDQDTMASADGTLSLLVTPMLRSQLSLNDVVRLDAPWLEGWISGNELAWTIDTARFVGLAFSVTERA